MDDMLNSTPNPPSGSFNQLWGQSGTAENSLPVQAPEQIAPGIQTMVPATKQAPRFAVAGMISCVVAAMFALFICTACSSTASSAGSGAASSASSGAATTSAAAASSATESTSNASAAATESATTSDKPVKDGFDEATNRTAEYAGVEFSIPSYYGETTADNPYTPMKDDEAAALYMLESKANYTNQQFEKTKGTILDSLADTFSKTSFEKAENSKAVDTTICDLPAVDFSFGITLNGYPGIVRGIIFFNENAQAVGLLTVLQLTDLAEFNYIPDFEKVIASATLAESSGADKDSAEAGETAESGEVDPELKEMLDSYEAFMDEYIAFMEEYQNSDDLTGMLQDYTDYMQRYSDVMQKINAVDTNDLSPADYAYYIEVTTRVSEKLLKVAL